MSQQKASFRILVSTDNHLGYKENHHILGDDSFDAFEEILQAAKRNSVDFLLLGGDLFHEITPS
jgi:double-strand break repair protein MRE11